MFRQKTAQKLKQEIFKKENKTCNVSDKHYF